MKIDALLREYDQHTDYHPGKQAESGHLAFAKQYGLGENFSKYNIKHCAAGKGKAEAKPMRPDIPNPEADEGDNCDLEKEPLQALAAEGQLSMYPHPGQWQCMDTLRDSIRLNELWSMGEAFWA